jgi:hypothetical protein
VRVVLHVFLAAVVVFAACSSSPAPPAPNVAAIRPLGTFSGRGNQTIGVVSESGWLRVAWRTHSEHPPGTGTFRLSLHSGVSGRPIELITDERGAGEGRREVADDPRPYNLMVESANLEWTFSVEEIVAAPPRGR